MTAFGRFVVGQCWLFSRVFVQIWTNKHILPNIKTFDFLYFYLEKFKIIDLPIWDIHTQADTCPLYWGNLRVCTKTEKSKYLDRSPWSILVTTEPIIIFKRYSALSLSFILTSKIFLTMVSWHRSNELWMDNIPPFS